MSQTITFTEDEMQVVRMALHERATNLAVFSIMPTAGLNAIKAEQDIQTIRAIFKMLDKKAN